MVEVTGGHGHSHGHSHGRSHGASAARAGARHRRPLILAFALTLAFLGVQIGVAVATDSLALISDAGHMATDVLGLGLAVAAITLATRSEGRDQHTFGVFRLEILAALVNAVLMFGVASYVFVEAAQRFSAPPEVASVPVLVVGVIGLAVNIAAFLLLREGAQESLNVQGAYLEVVSDAVGSVGVIVGAAVMGLTGWGWVDPVIGVGIGAFILPRAWKLGREAVRVLLQAAPAHIDLDTLSADLVAIDGVVDVHDLHVWTLTSEMEVLTAHLMTEASADSHAVLDQAREVLAERHGLHHATLQVEPDNHQGCSDVTW